MPLSRRMASPCHQQQKWQQCAAAAAAVLSSIRTHHCSGTSRTSCSSNSCMPHSLLCLRNLHTLHPSPLPSRSARSISLPYIFCNSTANSSPPTYRGCGGSIGCLCHKLALQLAGVVLVNHASNGSGDEDVTGQVEQVVLWDDGPSFKLIQALACGYRGAPGQKM